jgi:NitT/TauT family transport system substrate-binding protein
MNAGRRVNALLVLTLIAVLASLVVGTAPAAARVDVQQATSVTVRMDFFLNEAHAGFFAALKRGYYAREGLNVEIRPGAGSVSTVQQVASGNDTFGLASAVAMTQQVARGADVVAIASPRQVFDGGILYWPDRGIRTPRDLEGKNVAITAAGFVALLLPTWAARVNLELRRVNTRVLDTVSGNALFAGRQVDALEGTRAQQLFYAPVNGVKPQIFPYANAGLNALGQAVITRPRWVRQNPGTTVKFLRATMKGWAWACDNPRAATTLVRENIQTSNAYERSLATWRLICSFRWTAASKGRPLGWMSIRDWGTTVRMLRSSPQLGLENAVPGADKLFTNFYINQAHKRK